MLNGLTILLIEDREADRYVLTRRLNASRATVVSATCGAEARSMLSLFTPNILVSDIRLPDENGMALLRELRNRGSQVPAIAVSAYAEYRAHAADAGFSAFVEKGDEPGLVSAVATALGRN